MVCLGGDDDDDDNDGDDDDGEINEKKEKLLHMQVPIHWRVVLLFGNSVI